MNNFLLKINISFAHKFIGRCARPLQRFSRRLVIYAKLQALSNDPLPQKKVTPFENQDAHPA
jgi:hypothetical protein